MSAWNTITLSIQNWYYNFPNNTFETAEFWCIVSLTVFLLLLQRKKSSSLLSVVFIVP